jgi:alpha-tubulin suppressor-like RCC1 family protein
MRIVSMIPLVAVAMSVAFCGFRPRPTSGMVACVPGGATCCPENYVCVGRGAITAEGTTDETGTCWSKADLPPEALSATHDYTQNVLHDPACLVTDWLPPGMGWPDAGNLGVGGRVIGGGTGGAIDGGSTGGEGGSVVGVNAGLVACGDLFTCAVVNGGAKCWGKNADGQLGDNTTKNKLVPVQVVGLESGVTAVATGESHSCAVVNGGVKCWGDNLYGQLGDNSFASSSVPVQPVGLGSGVSAIAAGTKHSCAVVYGGVQCWGDNHDGQLGDGTAKIRQAPVKVSGLTSDVTAISTGDLHTCAVVKGGAKCWGDSTYGQHGTYGADVSYVPIQMGGLPAGKGVTAIAAGGGHTCVVINGGVKCCGNGLLGEIGDGTLSIRYVPTQVVGLLTGATAVATGWLYSCALVNGGVQCWGMNCDGVVCDYKTQDPATTPVQVVGLESGVTAIATGAAHACASVNGGVQCWGNNLLGALGNNTTTDSTTPVTVQFP